MQAQVGDHVMVPGHRVGEVPRECEVIEVRGEHGAPPYVVRWTDGHAGVYFPSTDALVVHR